MKCCEESDRLAPLEDRPRADMTDFRLLAGRNLLCVDLGRRYEAEHELLLQARRRRELNVTSYKLQVMKPSMSCCCRREDVAS